MNSMLRRLIKTIHPEGIPWPGSLLYNKISRSRIFQKNYEVVAKDILSYGRAGELLDIGTGPGWLLMHLARLSPLPAAYRHRHIIGNGGNGNK